MTTASRPEQDLPARLATFLRGAEGHVSTGLNCAEAIVRGFARYNQAAGRDTDTRHAPLAPLRLPATRC